MGRDAVHVAELEGGEAHGDQSLFGDAGVGAAEKGAETGVEGDLPAQDAEDERGGEGFVGGAEG